MDQSTIRVLVAAVVGAGVVIGTAGLFLYNEIYGEKRRVAMQQRELSRLGTSVAELRAELLELQSRQRSGRSRHRARSDTDSEYASLGVTDDDDDEFFDISDEDGVAEPLEPELARLLKDTDALLAGSTDDKRDAYRQLLDNLEQYEDSIEVQWRLAKACSNMATIYSQEDDKERRKLAIEQGLTHAVKAMALDDECAAAHKWYAILVGSRSEFGGVKDKIEDGNVFKLHLDRALNLAPRDYSLHHLLGRFKYEVAMLSWLERKMAAALFAEPPSASMSEAVSDCLSAEELSPEPWKQNRLLLAKCLVAQSDFQQALGWLDRAAEVPVKTADDEAAHGEVQALLAKYDGYRS